MRARRLTVAVVAVAVVAVGAGVYFAAFAQPGSSPGPASPARAKADSPAPPRNAKQAKRAPAGGLEALKRAAQANRHVFLLFHKGEGSPGLAKKQIIDRAVAKLGGKAEAIAVDTKADSAKDFLRKFRVDPWRMPLPLVLVVAPNGAVVGSFAITFDEKKLMDSLASPGMAACLKALQDGKIAVLCIQNDKTADNAAAMKGVNELVKDKKYAKTTTIIRVDPKDTGEKSLLRTCGVKPDIPKAVTILLAPPGKLAGTFVGATAKDKFIAALTACGAGCASPG